MSKIETGIPTDLDAKKREDELYKKVTLHLMPLLMLCYIVSYLDRVNVGFAKLQMQDDLGISNTVYGFGAGLFFVGYFFFEVPSNLILYKLGARKWIARIMISWGIVSAASLFVRTPFQFYFMRLLLGAAEAGFYPGILLYLTLWFPSAKRSRVVALFLGGMPIAMMIGGPLSGMIMQYFSGAGGLRGWQWMFLLEALPAVILGFVILRRLENHASEAKWLTEDEKVIIARNVDEEQRTKVVHPSLLSVFKDGLLLFFGLIYIACTMSQTGLGMWVPTLVEKVGVKNLFAVGAVSAFPYFVAAICMWFIGVHADNTRERRWHFAIPAFIGALGLFAIPSTAGNLPLAALAITFAAAGAVTSVAMFWSLPTAVFGGTSAAAGLALINSVGNLGGFAGPFVVGWLVDVTHKTNAGMYALAGVLMAGGLAVIVALPKKLVNK